MEKISEDVIRVDLITDGKPVTQYKFKTKKCNLEDFEVACHYQQTSPDSHFTHKKVISLLTENGRVSLSENFLKITKGDVINETPIENNEDFEEKLWQLFQIKIK